ncbi:3,4-dihydroxy-2-butanone-4-phosphate synthase [Bacillus oleronius]|nr:3,4-dihydroxy-2-butanone-4-phosphate synthase [Heyndrickxia oleronia]
MFDSIEEALDELRAGKVIIVCDDEDRENEGDFVALAEKATPDVINFMITQGKGLVCVPVDEKIANRLELAPMTTDNTDHFGTAFTISVDHNSTTTGISAYERSTTIRELSNSTSVSSDFKRPGHIFPLIAKEGGVLTRPGHTEAAVDFAKLAGASPAGVICEVINEDGTMARVQELRKIADEFQLKLVTIHDLIRYRKEIESNIRVN